MQSTSFMISEQLNKNQWYLFRTGANSDTSIFHREFLYGFELVVIISKLLSTKFAKVVQNEH